MTRRGLGVGVILQSVREERGLRADAAKAAGELGLPPFEVIGAHLVDRDQHDQRRRRRAECARCSRARREAQQREAAGKRLPLSAGALCTLRRDEIQLVRSRIEGHRLGARLRLDGVEHRERVAALPEHVHGAVAVRREDEASFRVEHARIHVVADRERLHHVPVIGVDDGQHVIAAAEEETPALAVHRECGWCGARRDRPPVLEHEAARINLDELVRGLDVDEEVPAPVGHCGLGSAAQRDGPFYLARRGVDGRGALPLSVHREHASRCGVERDGVGIGARANVAEHVPVVERKDRRAGVVTVRDEAAAQQWSERDPVYAGCVRDRVHDAAARRVHDEHVVLVRDVEQARAWLERQIIPPLGAAQRDASGEMVAGVGGTVVLRAER